jgi:uncharacterized protein (DUF983 family)
MESNVSYEPPPLRMNRVLWRALLGRCPWCGRARAFRSWFAMREVCPACGLRFQRNEESDYWVGGWLVNFILAELTVAVLITVAIRLSWPEVNWDAILWWTVAAACIGPLLTWPFAKGLWLGLDLRFRPPESADFTGADGVQPETDGTQAIRGDRAS